jgi:hypothetical protein
MRARSSSPWVARRAPTGHGHAQCTRSGIPRRSRRAGRCRWRPPPRDPHDRRHRVARPQWRRDRGRLRQLGFLTFLELLGGEEFAADQQPPTPPPNRRVRAREQRGHSPVEQPWPLSTRHRSSAASTPAPERRQRSSARRDPVAMLMTAPAAGMGITGCRARRRRSRCVAARTRCETCSPARRPRPRSPTMRGHRRRARPSITCANTALVANSMSSGSSLLGCGPGRRPRTSASRARGRSTCGLCWWRRRGTPRAGSSPPAPRCRSTGAGRTCLGC